MTSPKKWQAAAQSFCHPRVITMLFFGFSAGLPILLIFSSLSLWLREAGVERSAVTFFSWAALGYSFKFVWAPLVDQMPIPWLTRKLGRRRSWILAAQMGTAAAIVWMALTDPASGHHPLTIMALAAVMLGFSSATQDIVIDAYRIESASVDLQAMMASAYIGGYRVGMLVAGAGALVLAEWFGSTKGGYRFDAWQATYLIMAGLMGVGMITALVIPEPASAYNPADAYSSKTYLTGLALFGLAAAMFVLVFYGAGIILQDVRTQLGHWMENQTLAGFMVECVRLGTGILAAVLVGRLCLFFQLVNRKWSQTAMWRRYRTFFPLSVMDRLDNFVAGGVISHLRYRTGRDFQCVLPGSGIHKIADCQGGENLRTFHDHCRWICRRNAVHSIRGDSHFVFGGGSVVGDQPAVHGAGLLRAQPDSFVCGDRGGQSGSRTGVCRVCRFSVQPDQCPFHSRSICGIQFFDDADSQTVRRVFRHHGGCTGISLFSFLSLF